MVFDDPFPTKSFVLQMSKNTQTRFVIGPKNIIIDPEPESRLVTILIPANSSIRIVLDDEATQGILDRAGEALKENAQLKVQIGELLDLLEEAEAHE